MPGPPGIFCLLPLVIQDNVEDFGVQESIEGVIVDGIVVTARQSVYPAALV